MAEKILGVTWKDMVSNEKIRERTGMENIEDILRRRRLRWLGQVYWMNDNKIPKQALKWSPADGKRKKGRPRKNWKTIVIEDLKTMEMDMDWDEAEQAAKNRLV